MKHPNLIAVSELIARPRAIDWGNVFDWRFGRNMPGPLADFDLWWIALSIKLGLSTMRLYSLEPAGIIQISLGPGRAAAAIGLESQAAMQERRARAAAWGW